MLLLWLGCQTNSGLAALTAGGTTERPWVLASTVRVDNLPKRRTGQDTPSWPVLLRYAPGQTSATAELSAPIGSIAGVHGDHVWMLVQREPVLLDVGAGRVVFAPGALGDRHAPLAKGLTPTGHGLPGFHGNVHARSGALGLTGGGQDWVLTLEGKLLPLEAHLAATGSTVPKEPRCRGGRRLVCGTQVCMRAEAVPDGGERLAFSGSPRAARPTTEVFSPSLHGPEAQGVSGCIQPLSSGAIAVTHRGRPRRGDWDRLSAVKPDGSLAWTVERDEVLGELEPNGPVRVDVVGDRVVVSGRVSSLTSGSRLAVGSVDGTTGGVVPAR